MGEYNTVVSTKISEEDFKLLQEAAKERYTNGLMNDPSVSRLLRLLIIGYLQKYPPGASPYNDIQTLK